LKEASHSILSIESDHLAAACPSTRSLNSRRMAASSLSAGMSSRAGRPAALAMAATRPPPRKRASGVTRAIGSR
jgi:hypothetical protein